MMRKLCSPTAGSASGLSAARPMWQINTVHKQSATRSRFSTVSQITWVRRCPISASVYFSCRCLDYVWERSTVEAGIQQHGRPTDDSIWTRLVHQFRPQIGRATSGPLLIANQPATQPLYHCSGLPSAEPHPSPGPCSSAISFCSAVSSPFQALDFYSTGAF